MFFHHINKKIWKCPHADQSTDTILNKLKILLEGTESSPCEIHIVKNKRQNATKKKSKMTALNCYLNYNIVKFRKEI